MSRRTVIASSDEETDDDNATATARSNPKKVAKAKRVASSAADGDNEEEPSLSGKKRPKRPTKKQHAAAATDLFSPDKENIDKARAVLLRAQKNLASLEKAGRQQEQGPELSDGPESKDDGETILFSSSVRPLAPSHINQDVTPLRRAPRESLHSQPTRNASPILSPTMTDATVLANKRARSLSITDSESTSTPSSKRPKPHELLVTLRPGLKLSDKPTLRDFSDIKVQSLLNAAARDYECKIITSGPFPDHAQQLQRTRSCWDDVQLREGRKSDDGTILKYELTERMVRLIKSRHSRARGIFLDDARKEVKSQYGFVDGSNARLMSQNLKILESLVTHDYFFFHYKDPKTQTGYCDNPIIVNILAQVCFEDQTSFGVLYPKEFNPIPIETLAFILMVVHHCIKEWTLGKRNRVDFTTSDNTKHYKVFYADLLAWQKLNKTATTLKRAKMYRRALAKGGAAVLDAPKPQLKGEAEERARKELEAYTGETDSEEDKGVIDDEA
ncbi:hypothetical protein H0H93_006021 [Arthromyces matolae]|nr:hypothetical protein H0H93_006021 [Arthromyces matolae]